MRLKKRVLLACAMFALFGCASGPGGSGRNQTGQPLPAPAEPATVAQAVKSLAGLAASVDKSPALPPPNGHKVRYCTGISTSMFGLVVNGTAFDKNPNVKPVGVFFHEFYYDSEGRLTFIVACPPDGHRYLSNRLLYDGPNVIARLSFDGKGVYGYGEFGCWRHGMPFVVCRFRDDGTILATHEVAPTEGRAWVLYMDLSSEDYRKRDKATHELARMGKDAWPVIAAGSSSADIEVKTRCMELWEQLNKASQGKIHP